MTTHLDVPPDVVEALGFENPGSTIELDPETRRLHLHVGPDRYVSEPLPLIGRAS